MLRIDSPLALRWRCTTAAELRYCVGSAAGRNRAGFGLRHCTSQITSDARVHRLTKPPGALWFLHTSCRGLRRCLTAHPVQNTRSPSVEGSHRWPTRVGHACSTRYRRRLLRAAIEKLVDVDWWAGEPVPRLYASTSPRSPTPRQCACHQTTQPVRGTSASDAGVGAQGLAGEDS